MPHPGYCNAAAVAKLRLFLPFYPIDDDEARNNVRQTIFLGREEALHTTCQLFGRPFQILGGGVSQRTRKVFDTMSIVRTIVYVFVLC